MKETAACVALLLAAWAQAAAPAPTRGGGNMAKGEPLCISGIYPHLAVYNGSYDAAAGMWRGTGSECGIGAVVPWAGRLWLITYPPHETRGGRDKLWTIDEDLTLRMRPESVGGTHASRMIHRESKQLVIGPYFVDANGTVRAADVKKKLVGRMTAAMRHLTDPANRIYLFDMEGAIYEVNVHSLAVTKLFAKPVPGWHGKGGYTGQGRVIIANNGERRASARSYPDLQVGGPPKHRDEIGCLAEWDGREWRLVERKQFLDVTGPGGIHGAPDDEAPVWAMGWDRRSCILKLLDGGAWRTFRLPKASYCFDPAHGWYTEWPRIREVGGGQWMMDLHGMFYDFPPDFRAGRTGGLKPIASHLRYIPDFCDWNGRLVIGADDASIMKNPMCGKAQSNLWFGRREDLRRWGPPAGWGGPWVGDAVKAGQWSVPFAVGGFRHRCLHVSTNVPAPASGRMRCTDKYEITRLPAELAPLAAVTIDRGDYHEPAPGYAFTVNQEVVAYLAMDARGTPDPGAGWRRTTLGLEWGGQYRDVVYRRTFAKGRIEIPGRSDKHKGGHFALPNTCFVGPARPGAGPLEITDLPAKLGGRATRGAPPTRPRAAGTDFAIEVDRDGSGRWAPCETLSVGESGYAWRVLPPDLAACWVRLKPSRDCTATAYLHCASPRRAERGEEAIVAAVPKAGDAGPTCAGLIRPAGHNTRLQFVARVTGADGEASEAGYWEVDETMTFHRVEPGRAEQVRKIAAIRCDFDVDAASAVMTYRGRRYRLPKGSEAFDRPLATGWPRGIRECQSERYLVNVHGTFYEMPRDTGVPHLKPVCTHNRRIVDFCSWRGLLVMSGTRRRARPDGQYFASAGGEVGLWFGKVDDLWKLGKPVGHGGPWLATSVRADEPSDPYLMTGFDRKSVELSHDADEDVAFTIEVDFLAAGSWCVYKTISVPPGRKVRHEFPDGFGAHWVRLRAGRNCTATAGFTYR